MRCATNTAAIGSASHCSWRGGLIERGVRFVTVNTFLTVFNEITWDIHGSVPFTSIEGMKKIGRSELSTRESPRCSTT